MEVDPVSGSGRLPTFSWLTQYRRILSARILKQISPQFIMPNSTVTLGLIVAMSIATLAPSCSSMVWTANHHGIRYSIHRDKHSHKIVKGKNGSLMYDSPELVVLCENNRLIVNGQECGSVGDGDLVQVTEIGTVLVNGERRGDKLTGRVEMQKRLKDATQFMETHSGKELEYKSRQG